MRRGGGVMRLPNDLENVGAARVAAGKGLRDGFNAAVLLETTSPDRERHPRIGLVEAPPSTRFTRDNSFGVAL
jgi:hypothetical protein